MNLYMNCYDVEFLTSKLSTFYNLVNLKILCNLNWVLKSTH